MFLPAAPRSSSSKHIPAAEHGFHLGSTGQPLALIQYGDDWWVRASHELVELLCDPWGKRTVAGPSLDAGPERGGLPGGDLRSVPARHLRDQRRRGVGLRDARLLRPGRRCRAGATASPARSRCRASCFRADTSAGSHGPPENRIYQAFAPPAKSGIPKPVKADALRIEPLRVEPVAPTFSRALVDSRPTAPSGRGRPARRQAAAAAPRIARRPPRRRRTGIRCAAKST